MKIYIENFEGGRKSYSNVPTEHLINGKPAISRNEYDLADEKMFQDFMDNPSLYNVVIEGETFTLTKK
jgi:hypothetical protein